MVFCVKVKEMSAKTFLGNVMALSTRGGGEWLNYSSWQNTNNSLFNNKYILLMRFHARKSSTVHEIIVILLKLVEYLCTM